MLIQGTGIVLGQYCNLLDAGVCHIAKGKIYTSVASGNRHCCNCPLI